MHHPKFVSFSILKYFSDKIGGVIKKIRKNVMPILSLNFLRKIQLFWIKMF